MNHSRSATIHTPARFSRCPAFSVSISVVKMKTTAIVGASVPGAPSCEQHAHSKTRTARPTIRANMLSNGSRTKPCRAADKRAIFKNSDSTATIHFQLKSEDAMRLVITKRSIVNTIMLNMFQDDVIETAMKRVKNMTEDAS
uniref:Uncharacterized protein n=1 Tax=Hyaloperonospora arabidopsidis (strain Emoy2) TaxID=559515 RepID=M4B811_HYAAE